MTKDSLPTTDEHSPVRHRCWVKKFANAGRGIQVAICSEASFAVHLSAAALVLIVGVGLEISRWEWCLIVLCVAIVLAAEMFNTSVERLAKAITGETRAEIRDALDMASGAVLIVAIGAAIVGMFLLGTHALGMINKV